MLRVNWFFKLIAVVLFAVGCSRHDTSPGVSTPEGEANQSSRQAPPSAPTFQGHETGNGGGGIRCEGKPARLFDFWEATKFGGLSIPLSNALVVKKQIMMACGALFQGEDRSLAEMVRQISLDLLAQSQKGELFTPDDETIEPPADWPFAEIPTTCAPFGIGYYYDAFERLGINQQAFDSLANTDKAGFFVHESIFRIFRARFGIRDSRFARNLTACAFADVPCPKISYLHGLPSHEVGLCSEGNTLTSAASSFYVYQSPKGGIRFHARRLKGGLPPTLTYFDIPGSLSLEKGGVSLRPDGKNNHVVTYSKSNEDVKFPIGPSLRFEARFGDGLWLNGKKLKCEITREPSLVF